jgi:multidrug resistance efflux pump
LQSARLERDSNVHAARDTLLTAQADLQKLQAGARPQEISNAEGAVQQAQATRDRAATELKRVQLLYQKGIKARRDVDDAQTALQVDGATLQQAKAQLSLLQAGARPQELKAAQVQVDDAERALKQAQQSGDTNVKQAQAALDLAQQNAKQTPALRLADVHDARLQVSAARSALQTAKSNGAAKVHQANLDVIAARQASLQVSAQSAAARASQADVRGKAAEMNAAQVNASAAELRAPISGVVTARNLNPGDLASPSTAILKISNLNTLGLAAQISSAKGGSLHQGMSARIHLSDAPSKVLWGGW